MKMKKYLMTGIAALALCVGFTSCSHDLEVNQEKIDQLNAEKVVKEYEAAFIRTFGQPAANQDWGFSATRTRTAEPRGNEWASMGYTIPDDIGTDEYNAVMAVFNTVGAASYESLVDWDCFFVQQVHKGTATYYARNQYNNDDYTQGLKENAQPLVGSDHMDYLYTLTTKKEVVTCWSPYESEIQTVAPYEDHIFDFNNSNSEDYGGRMLMVNSNTNVFGYYSSEDSQSHRHFRMEYIEPYGYFVGFDFSGEGSNPNQDIKRDYIYNDWIVKIVPGKGMPLADLRVICEDLNAGTEKSDFDFNDVVFDVYYGAANEAKVVLRAAGGTLPVKVAGVNVHEKMGDARMINTNGTQSSDPNVRKNSVDGVRSQTIPLSFAVNNALDAKNIKVEVFKNNEWIELTAERGKVASKVAVGPKHEWCDEREYIGDGFKQFAQGLSTYNEWYTEYEANRE
jgi:hypothetical protein